MPQISTIPLTQHFLNNYRLITIEECQKKSLLKHLGNTPTQKHKAFKIKNILEAEPF